MGVLEGKFPQWAYLIGYNAISALLWAFVFSKTSATALTDGLGEVYPALRLWVWATQGLAALDIVHSIIGMLISSITIPGERRLTSTTGLIHAPLLTTVVQVAGRCTVLWVVIEPYPSAALSSFYAWMVLAWSAADAVRYFYFAMKLIGGHQYWNLTWLRYSAFYVLYPVGIASEVGIVYNAVSEAFQLECDGHAWAYIAAATLYIPGTYLARCRGVSPRQPSQIFSKTNQT